jgi:hypothetical protein
MEDIVTFLTFSLKSCNKALLHRADSTTGSMRETQIKTARSEPIAPLKADKAA